VDLHPAARREASVGVDRDVEQAAARQEPRVEVGEVGVSALRLGREAVLRQDGEEKNY